MSTVEEAFFARTPLGADLKAGVDQISYDQTITFTQYKRVVLPLDGFVFWVRADLVSPSFLLNAARPNQINQPGPVTLNKPQVQTTAAPFRTVQGSLHYATDRRQEEAETYAVNQVVFTAETSIDFLNSIDPLTIYIAEFEGIRFSFSSRGAFYRQAKLYHYVGNAVYADMATQLVDAVDGLDTRTLVVSNSLPAWLELNGFNPPWPFYPNYQPAPLYPSFLSPPNLMPPWGTVHIGEGDTRALEGVPRLGHTSSMYQLAADKVRVTLWGVRNTGAMDFLQRVLQYSYDTNIIGIMNTPIVIDAKRTQSELTTLAQKKIIDFEVSYNQARIADVARQLIVTVIPTYLPRGLAA